MSNQMIYRARIREFACLDTTSSVPPPVKVNPKSKKDKSNQRDPSYWEHVNSFFDNASPGVNASSSTKKRLKKPHLPYIDQFSPQIHPYIENIVDVKADENCGYRVISECASMR